MPDPTRDAEIIKITNGSTIESAAAAAIERAGEIGRAVSFEFNGHLMSVRPESVLDDVVELFCAAIAARELIARETPTRDAEIEALAERVMLGYCASGEDFGFEDCFATAEAFIGQRDAWRERRAEG